MTIKKMCLMNRAMKTLLACTRERRRRRRTRTTTARCTPVRGPRGVAEGGRAGLGEESCRSGPHSGFQSGHRCPLARGPRAAQSGREKGKCPPDTLIPLKIATPCRHFSSLRWLFLSLVPFLGIQPPYSKKKGGTIKLSSSLQNTQKC